MSDYFSFLSLVRQQQSLVWQFRPHFNHARVPGTFKGHFTAQLIAHRPMANRNFWNHRMVQRTGTVYALPQIYTHGVMDIHNRQGHSHSCAYTDVHGQGTTISSPHIQESHIWPSLLLFLGWQRQEFASVTHITFPSFTNTHLWFPQALAPSLPRWLEIKGSAGSYSWCQDPTDSRSRHQGPGGLTAPV